MRSPEDLRAPPGGDGPAPADMRTFDLSSADLKSPGDMSQADLMMPPDLFMPDLRPPTLEPRPACMDAVVMATAVYPTVQMKCGGNGFCHLGANGMAGNLRLGANAAEFRAAVVNKDPTIAQFKLVVPGNIDASYLLYKLLGLQRNVPGGGGGQMPQGDMLSDAEKCLFINWVKSGAN
ncbi:MAG: hypothetical protein RMK29_12295 [Myxococcales bacterium]|nr:hypothetical protein [Myxococcota bacterium]MDW8282485.1 hypothetical protein [Myxococcales bacterium]